MCWKNWIIIAETIEDFHFYFYLSALILVSSFKAILSHSIKFKEKIILFFMEIRLKDKPFGSTF
jgi:hypothetical protein